MKNPLALLSDYFKRTAFSASDDFWYYPVHRPSVTGVAIDEGNALENSDVYKCVRVISESLASLPLFVYKKLKGGGKERAEDHPLYEILHTQPNPEMTAFQYRETMMYHLLDWGNHYSQIEKNGMGDILALWPLRPDRMKIKRGTTTFLKYVYLPVDSGVAVEFDQDEILHIAGLGFNGVTGFSPIAMAREAVGLGKAAEEFAGRFFSNDATPGGILEHPGKLSATAHDNLNRDITQKFSGLPNKWKFIILEEGLAWKPTTVPLKEAQFLELRKFQREEICGIYRVPPHMIQDLSRATFSNIEQQALDFVTNTLRPWAVRVEQSMLVKLFSEKERKRYFPEHLFEGMLRGDIQTRYAAYAQARNWGWLCVDEIREYENLNPLPDDKGKIYLQPLNMIETGEEPPPVKVPAPTLQPKEEPVKEVPKEEKKSLDSRVTIEERKAYEVGDLVCLRIRVRMIDATDFTRGSLEHRVISETEYIGATIGKLKDSENDSFVTQSFTFDTYPDSGTWTVDKAVTWVKENQDNYKKWDEEKGETKSSTLYASFSRLFETEIGRIVRRESIAIRRALKKPDLETFISHMDEFYRSLPEWMTKNLFPVLKSYGELNGVDDVTEVLKEFIAEHVRQSREEIERWIGVYLHEADWGKNIEPIEEILDGWQENRPSRASDGFHLYFMKKIEEKRQITEKKPEILTFSINNYDFPRFTYLLANSTIAVWATT